MALHFTKQQIDEIEQALIARSKKDSQFPGADQLEGTELIPIIQNGTNKVTTYAGLWAQVSRELREYVEQALNTKVDKVEGKELSENDFTDAFKDKLEGVEAGAQVNVQSDWTALSGDAFIKNKPDLTIYATRAAVEDIEALIPIQAAPTNQLADKNFVNSSIATSTAEFKGTYSTLAELETVSANVNDYGYVVTTDSAGNTVYDRYKYNGENWIFEYSLNNSSFTAAEWAAIQSGITAALVQKLETVQANAQVNVIEGVRVDGTLLPIVNKEVDIQVSGVTGDLRTEDKTDQEFFYRQTADGELNWVPSTACVEKLKGKSLAWNQIIKNGNFNGTTDWSANKGTIAASNSIITFTAVSPTAAAQLYQSSDTNFIANHKYLFSSCVKSSVATTIRYLYSGYGNVSTLQISANTWTEFKRIITPTTIPNTHPFSLYFNVNGELSDGDTVQVENVICTDLTLMFGAGNEPSTVAEFESMFPLPYYDYNAGTLLSFNGHYLKTVGFNQWDEEWEAGKINSTNGINSTDATRIRSKNYIPVFGGQSYYLKNGGSGVVRVFTYDANKNYLTYYSANNAEFIPSAETAYIRICPDATYGTSYNYNICISLSSSRNGQYEPYKETLVKTNPTELTSNGVQIFPYGLQSAGNVYDEVTETKAIKRIGRVDLGMPSWVKDWGGLSGFFSCQISGIKAVPNVIFTDFIQVKYKAANSQSTLEDKTCFHFYSRFFVRDTAYTDAATFKTAMLGVYLNYELATPIVYDLDEPLDLKTVVDINGTEQVYPENTSTPYTAPIRADIQYGLKSSQLLTELRIADSLRFERDFTVTDYSGDHSGESVGFDGSEDATLVLPEVINGQVERNTEISRTEEFHYQPVPVKHFNDAYKVDKIYGKTLAWSQLVPNNKKSFTVAAGETNEFSSGITATIGHKYLLLINQGVTLVSNVRNTFRIGNQYQDTSQNYSLQAGLKYWITIAQNSNSFGYWVNNPDKNVTYDNFQTIDLTLLYGSEIDGMTDSEILAKFESEFPGYHEYNAGSLISNDASALETVGRNLWDEEWEVVNNRVVSKNFISVTPGSVYFLFGRYSILELYDSNKNLIGSGIPSGSVIENDTYTVPDGVYFIKFALSALYGTTYNHDACLNLSDSNFNGQYEPYRKSTLPLNLDDFWVKDGQGNLMHITDGLKSAGSVYDEIVGNTYIKRIGEVDLGDLTWTSGSTGLFVASETQIPNILNSQERAMICSLYAFSSAATSSAMPDKSIANNQWNTGHFVVLVKDSAYTAAAAFKTAMDGVMLYYELATPIEYELAEPMLDSGWIDENGTMRVVYEDESAPHVQFKSDITYGVNAGHIIDKANEIIKSFKEKLETLWDAVFNNS